MRSLKSKVAKMERGRHGKSEADRRHDNLLHHRLCACLVAHQPGMVHVRPEHTDPETFRDIQETLAWARGDYAEAERLAEQRAPEHEPLPRDWRGFTTPERTRLVQQALDRCAEQATDRTERVRAAIEAASPTSTVTEALQVV